jgi:solute carrier family 13 (sodium-dependent dicarboxylate transporter), member 2/3/5
VAAGLVLFVIPVDVRERTFAMDWETARLPWGILILFGGGLSLAAAVQANGVSEFLGHQAAGPERSRRCSWSRPSPPS